MCNGAYLLLAAVHGACCSDEAVSLPGVAEFVDLFDSIIGLFSSSIGLVALIIGVKIINDLRMKGLDSACGFHARLSAQLKCLQTAVWVPGAEQKSVLCYCADVSARTDGKGGKIPEYVRFIDRVKRVNSLFEESAEQIPLSEKMFKSMDELQITLLDMIEADVNNLPLSFDANGAPVSGSVDVDAKTKEFVQNINDILDEIKGKMPKLLKELWEELD